MAIEIVGSIALLVVTSPCEQQYPLSFIFLALYILWLPENVGSIALLVITSPCEQQCPLSFPFLAWCILWLPEMWGVSHFWLLHHLVSSNVP